MEKRQLSGKMGRERDWFSMWEWKPVPEFGALGPETVLTASGLGWNRRKLRNKSMFLIWLFLSEILTENLFEQANINLILWLRPYSSENNVWDFRDVMYGPRPLFAMKFGFNLTYIERLPLQIVPVTLLLGTLRSWVCFAQHVTGWEFTTVFLKLCSWCQAERQPEQAWCTFKVRKQGYSRSTVNKIKKKIKKKDNGQKRKPRVFTGSAGRKETQRARSGAGIATREGRTTAAYYC